MFTLEAPYPLIQTTTLLPNNRFSGHERLTDEVAVRRSMVGGYRTYIKSKGRRNLVWEFHLSRNKAMELAAFLQSYFASEIRVTDAFGDVWIGHFVGNPFEFETARRAAPAIAPLPRGESVVITLEFEGTTQS